ncbi:cytochrome c oxidase subunit 5b-2, mitochondrial-like isoform X1 [Carya illinoinensis]|uniref:cytochrome c oxidase subunit 5b-2, mitochondrial-like isoform X1 n=1 Tax=Carya illinoinensis TaxID=32201 RepID=UPI001C723D6E|nr:cytochrome c oxidase subunit 5b-2, mitochondrial-like isoform X1 [Carya illinoinensis]
MLITIFFLLLFLASSNYQYKEFRAQLEDDGLPSKLFISTCSVLPVRAAQLSFFLLLPTAEGAVKKRVEDVMPIATGHEREELQAELEGRKVLDIDHPDGPFGTKDSPAIIKSYYDKRIVGCPGGEGEDEHDVVWFWLEKGKPHECPVCSQYFELEVVGPGGPPDGHGDDDHHH